VNGMMAWLTMGMGAPPGAAGQGPGGGPGMMIGYMLIIFALFYFMMIRPQQKKEKERKKLIASIKSGDRILFSNGILGTVTNVKEQTLSVKIADNVKIEIARAAVIRVLDKGEEPGEVEKSN
jgi:preprotein translocase subunit YajC